MRRGLQSRPPGFYSYTVGGGSRSAGGGKGDRDGEIEKWSFIPPPTERLLMGYSTRSPLVTPPADSGLGFFLLSHQITDGKTSNFASNVDEGVKALSNRELDQIGHFSTVTKLVPEHHLPLYCAACEWFASRLKELPRRRFPWDCTEGDGIWRGCYDINIETECIRGAFAPGGMV